MTDASIGELPVTRNEPDTLGADGDGVDAHALRTSVSTRTRNSVNGI
jgi:hypothetical protein